jgi:hypothetical protein
MRYEVKSTHSEDGKTNWFVYDTVMPELDPIHRGTKESSERIRDTLNAANNPMPDEIIPI